MCIYFMMCEHRIYQKQRFIYQRLTKIMLIMHQVSLKSPKRYNYIMCRSSTAFDLERERGGGRGEEA